MNRAAQKMARLRWKDPDAREAQAKHIQAAQEARAKLTPAELSERNRNAARARWKDHIPKKKKAESKDPA